MELKEGFIESIEKHPGLAYTDTDSIYIEYAHPEFDKYDPEQWRGMIDVAIELADEINNTIDQYVKNDLVERAGLDPDFQRLYFKTEMIALRMLQFPVKKTYALSYIYDEGKHLPKPKIKKTGGHVKKSSTPLISKKLINDVYKIMLYKKITTMRELKEKIFTELFNEYKGKFDEAFRNHNFELIGIPYKFGFGTKDITKWVWGALLFNTFISDQLRPGSSMYSVYVNYNKHKLRDLLQSMNIEGDYKLLTSDYFLQDKYDMLSVPVGYHLDEEFEKKLQFMNEAFDLTLSYDRLFDFDIIKKFEQFRPFFDQM